MGDFEASGRGEARRHPVRGKPRTTSAKGKLWANWRRGNPELCGARKALSHLGKGKTLSLLALGETPGHLAKRKLWATGTGIIWSRLAWGKPRVIRRRVFPEPPARGVP